MKNTIMDEYCFLGILLLVVVTNSEIQSDSPSPSHPWEVGKRISCESSTSLLQSCLDGLNCINKSQVCDGRKDCDTGLDESPEVCDYWVCDKGVRCRNSSVCIPVPHQTMCSGSKREAVCEDGSDQAYCLHTIYTGSFVNTSLGLRISNGDDCFCDLRDGEGARLFYRSMGRTHRSSHILGKVCISSLSDRICDGYTDCVNGEDEDPVLCSSEPESLSEEDDEMLYERSGRKLDILEEDTITGSLKEDTLTGSLKEEQDIQELDTEETTDSDVSMKHTVDLNLLLIIFTVTVISVLGFCLLIIYVMFKLSKRKVKESDYDEVSLPPSFDRQISNGSTNIYVSNPRSPPAERKPTWSLRTTSIVKELGRGFYSKVYLAQDKTHGLVALKTTDSQRSDKEDDCISNEIEILSNLPPQKHIIKLIGQNIEEKLIVLEYCFHGNLKDYVTRNRDYYIDEVDPGTGEVRMEVLYRSPTESDSFPDFSTSLHMNVNSEDETCKDVPVIKFSTSLVTTRRLLYWSYQISRGLRYLSEMGIIHRDVALRNMLLTNKDIIKISDFGLAASVDGNIPVSPSKTPQYWSRSNKPQPYKWMAPESFVANVYSQKSDVWGFGVTLWELFSLGQEPYGETNPASLQKMLNTGGRLQNCKFSPLKVGLLMRECWSSEPICRPNFNSIVGVLSSYINNQDTKKDTDSRSRTDSGMGDLDIGYLDMTLTPRDSSGFSTSDSTPSTSKYSTRSRESYCKPSSRIRRVSNNSSSMSRNGSVGTILTNGSISSGQQKDSSLLLNNSHRDSNLLLNNSSHQRDSNLLLNNSNQNLNSPRTSYWSNYKIVNGSSPQMKADLTNLHNDVISVHSVHIST